MNPGIAPLAERLSIIRSPEKCPELVIFTSDSITDEQAASIAEVLKISKSIIKLWLDRNSIKDAGAKELGDALKSNTSIQYLNISSNQITFAGATEIFKGLKVNRTLTALHFNQNQLVCDKPEQRELWIGLQFNKCLQVLSLSDNAMTDNTLLALCKGLASNRSLTSINLSGNAFSGAGNGPTILQGLSCPTLTQLDLSNNPWAPEVLPILGQALKNNPLIADLKLCRLPSVTLQGNEYNDFLTDLQSNMSLTSLNLADTPFSTLICDIVTVNKTISKLSVKGSLIRNDELNSLSKALSTNSTITYLDVSDMLARQDAIQAFCTMLKSHSSILTLNFAGNVIGEAASELSEVIRKNKVLRSMNIDGSKELTRVGKKILLFSLAANPPLKSFSMCDVMLEAELAPEIVKSLKPNTHLEEFHLRRNGIYSKTTTAEAAEPLLALFATSPSLIVLDADIPDPTGRLLTKHLEGRSITDFPPALLKMTSLQVLNLTNNFLTSIPAGISNLVELRELDVSNNRLLTLPPALGFLNNLKVLKLTNNAFRTPPPEVLSKNNVKLVLGYLRDLAKGAEPVYRIKLMMVGQENVGKTTILRHIKRRRLRRAPKKGPIKPTISTDGIDVDEWLLEVPFDDDKDFTLTTGGSSSTTPTLSATALMAQAAAASSSSAASSGSALGAGNTAASHSGSLGASGAPSGSSSGTSSASNATNAASNAGGGVRQLSRGSAGASNYNPARSSTDPEANKKFVTVSSWDFAGQEIYYTTHQFFLSQRSLYILVWDLRFEDDECKVSYWLQSIRSRTNNSPVIIVGTHADELPSIDEANAKAEKVRKKFQKRFPFIKYSLAVSAKNDSDINNLVSKIRDVIRVQDHTGELIPKTYVEMERLVRTECQNIKEGKASYPPIRSWTEIQTLASYCHINDEDELRRCIHLLHDFGSLIYFDDPSLGVQDLVIIDSQFLTNVMATIITTKTSIRDGLMPHNLIPMIWRPPEFPAEIHEILLSLLKKFEIAYTLPSSLRAKFGAKHLGAAAAAHLAITIGGPLSSLSPAMASSSTTTATSLPSVAPTTTTTTTTTASGGSGTRTPLNSRPPSLSTLPPATSLSLQGSPSSLHSPLALAAPTPLSADSSPVPSRASAGLSEPLNLTIGGTTTANGSLPSPRASASSSSTTATPPATGSSTTTATSAATAPLPTTVLLSPSNFPVGTALPPPAAFTLPTSLPHTSSLPPPNPLFLSATSLGSTASLGSSGLSTGNGGSLDSSSASVPSSPLASNPMATSLLPPAQLLNVNSAHGASSSSGATAVVPAIAPSGLLLPSASLLPTSLPQVTLLNIPAATALAVNSNSQTPVHTPHEKPAANVLPPIDEEGQLETLIPSLLPEDRPDFDLLWRSFDAGKTQFDRRYQLEFVPKGLFSRLMIRILHHVDSVLVYWRNGLIAEKGKDMFLMELRPHEAVLIVSARGPRSHPPVETFRMCTETVDMLIGLNNWFNIKVSKFVPCSHCIESLKEEAQVWLFPLTQLEDKAVEGQWLVECEASSTDRKQMHLTRLVPDMALTDLDTSKIKYEDLTLLEEIGKGAFGVIHRGMYGHREVAIKIMKGASQEGAKQKAFNEFRREVHVMSGMKHPNLVNMIGFCVNPFALVMELLPSGNLYKFLQKHVDNNDISWALRLKIALDVALGMHYLHAATPPFIHRDLKSPNILLLSTDYLSEVCAKVGDFGLSSRMYVPAFQEKAMQRDVGNPTWLAPEIIREQEFNVSSDVYSYGIILWELLVRKHPYSEYAFQFMFELEDIIKKGQRPTVPLDCPPEFANLITRCVADNPDDRPSFYEVIKIIVAMAADLAPELRIPEDLFSKLSNFSSEKSNSPSASTDASEVSLNGLFVKQLSTHPMNKIYSMALVGENQMWCGTREGSILIWSTKNGQLLARHENIHKAAITSLFVAGNYIWTHAWGEKARVWKTLDEAAIQNILDQKQSSIEGWLTQKTTGITKKLKRRFFTVTARRLYVYKAEGDKVPVTMIDLDGAKVVLDTKAKNPSFTVHPKSNRETKPVVIQTKDKQEQVDWMTVIEAEINRQDTRFDIAHVTEIDCSDMCCFTVMDDMVWGGSKEMRLKAWDPDRFTLLKNVEIDIAGLLPNGEVPPSLFITSITEFDNRVWLGAQKLLVCLDKDSLLPIRVLQQHTQSLNAILGYDGRIWTCSDDCTVRVWDAFSYELIQTFSEIGGKQFALIRVGPQIWAAGWDGIIRVFNGKTAQLQRSLELKHQDAIYTFAASHGSVWAGSWDGTLSIWS